MTSLKSSTPSRLLALNIRSRLHEKYNATIGLLPSLLVILTIELYKVLSASFLNLLFASLLFISGKEAPTPMRDNVDSES